jgi:hypothetical protein
VLLPVRGSIAALCIVALVLAVLLFPAAAPLLAILAPLWCFFLAVSVLLRDAADQSQRPAVPFLRVLAPRPPPIA